MTENTMSPTDLMRDVSLNQNDDLAIPPCEQEILILNEPFIASPAPSVSGYTEGAQCIALMGAAGGVGVTSLCIQLAHNLAIESQQKLQNKSKEPRVCVIDLDFESGSCAHHLDLTPNMSMTDLIQSPDHIDRAYISSLVATHSSGLDLLSVPNCLDGNNLANPATVVALLDTISEMYDHIIIDVPRYWRDWNIAAIGASDKFAIVTDLTIPSLHLARMRMESIEEKLSGHVSSEIILNKYERRSFRNALRQKDAETALNRKISSTICIDADTVREAINCGEPVGAIRPESRYVKDVRHVKKTLLKQVSIQNREAA